VLRHDQVTQVAKQADLFSSADPIQEASEAPTLMLVNHDEPQHRKLRNLVQGVFTASRVAAHEAWISKRIGEVLDTYTNTEVDVMQGLAADMPAMVMTRMLDMPPADFARFRRWATAFMLSAPMSAEERMQSNAQMYQYFVETVAARASQPQPDDFISALLAVEYDGGRLTQHEVVRFCFTLVVAGSETTTGLLGNLVWLMATQPASFEQIRQQPALIDGFIEEALRYAGPPQRLFRIATADVTLGTQTIRKGDWVAVFFAAANRDPAVWSEPDTFDIRRDRARTHYSFGHGIHGCLGSMLVRLQARCLLREICVRFKKVRPGNAAFERQTATQLTYGLRTCPVVFEAISAGNRPG
jgi:cytochrome P450